MSDPAPVSTRHLFPEMHKALVDLLRSLEAEAWHLPTACPGWSVHDVALHLLWGDISNLSRRRDRFFGRPQDDPGALDDLPCLITFVNDLNERWLLGARPMSPPLTIALLERTGPDFTDFLQTLDLNAMGEGVGWAGPGPAPVWLDVAREYTERWVHQQHIREATDRPGLTERRFLHPVLDTFALAMPFALRDTPAPPGTRVVLTVTGDAGDSWTAQRQAGGWTLVPTRAAIPDARVVLPQEVAWKRFTNDQTETGHTSGIERHGPPQLTTPLLRMVTVLA